MPTDQDYLALLAAADDSVRFEFPEGYDLQGAKARFVLCGDDLDTALGVKGDPASSIYSFAIY
jgi:hypothetical protein